LKNKKQILNNIFIEHLTDIANNENSSIENIYYINKIDKKYLLTAFEYTLPFNNKHYSFLSDNIFQSSSGFKDFHVAVYTNNRLKFQSGLIEFPVSLDDLKYFQNTYTDFIYHQKSIDDKNIVVAYTYRGIKDYISLFSSYFIAMLTLLLIFVYFYYAFLFKHLFPIRFLSFSQKIMLLVILISVVSFYFLFCFSYQYTQKVFSDNKRDMLLKEYYTFDFPSNKNQNILIYNTDGYLHKTSHSHPLIKFKLLSTKLPDEIVEKVLKNKLYFHKRQIGEYKYTSLLAIKDHYIIEFSYFDETYFREINLNNLLNPLFNVYALFFVISFFIGIVLSNYIVYPIRRIAEQFNNNTHPLQLQPLSYPYNDELGELVKNYNNLIKQLQQTLEQLKKEQQEKAWKLMAQQVAHDIKNSLTPLLLNIEYLQKKQNHSPQDVKILNSIKYQIELLARTAQDFSEIAQDIPVKKEKIYLPMLVKRIISQYDQYPEININLSEKCNYCEVETDAHLLSRVLINLINNAIDATEKEGHIEIEIRNTNNQSMLIAIKDNGCGIPPDIQDKIFEPKFSTKNSGKGLGLFIVKNICDKLNIAISFESKENQGTVFYLNIPNK
jgi:signal transduction histidine kinase